MIKYNNAFKSKYLDDLDRNINLPESLSKLLEYGFIKHSDGCIFFSKLQPSDCADKNNNFFDRTEIECWYNEIKLSDYVINHLSMFAPKFGFEVINRLSKSFPDIKFELIIIYDLFEDDLDITIKLHTIRKEDVPYINIDNLDNVEQPILILRT